MGRNVLFIALFVATSGCAMERTPEIEEADEVCSIDGFAYLPVEATASRPSPWLRYRYEGHPTSCWSLTVWVQDHPWLDRDAIMSGAAYWGVEGLRFSLTEDRDAADITFVVDDTVSCEEANKHAAARAGGRLGGVAVYECGGNLLTDGRRGSYVSIMAHEIGHAFRAVHIPLDCDETAARMPDGRMLCGDLALMNPSVFAGIQFVTELDHLDFLRAVGRNEEMHPIFVAPAPCAPLE